MLIPICLTTSKYKCNKGISGSALKVIAVVTMLIDHVGMIFFEELASTGVGYYRTYYILRIIGRLSFPIFAFLVSEGMAHTKNIYKYALRMLIFAIICEVPFDIAVNGTIIDLSSSNVFFTLFLSILPAVAMKFVSNKLIDKSNEKTRKIARIVAFVITLMISAVISRCIGTVFGYYGVALTITFYIFKKFKPFDIALAALLMLAAWAGQIQLYAIFSLPIIFFYNGTRGFINTKTKQYIFYTIYPLHLLIFYGISLFISR